MKKPRHRSRSLLAGVLCFFLTAGCAGLAGYAHFQRSSELTRRFESFEVLPEYRYYSAGPFDEPEAILGVHRDYRLATPTFWRPVDLTPARLKKWVQLLSSRYAYKDTYFASYVLGPEGKRIGIWYSNRPWTVVKRGEGDALVIYTPEQVPPVELGRGGDGDEPQVPLLP